jgi:putative ABC transport system permease protein
MRNKVFSFINIFGLAVGLAACVLIMLYILDEFSYDKHHKDGNQIFRVAYESKEGSWSANSAPLAFGVKNDLPEVEQAARLLKFPDLEMMLLTYEGKNDRKQFFEPQGFFVDSTFFELFSYDFKFGDGRIALNEPNTVVLSEKIADKLFGNENPVGKTIKVGMLYGENAYTVKGVYKNSTGKSHVPAGFFLSMQNGDIGQWVNRQTNWGTNNIFHTYLKLRKGVDVNNFEKKLGAVYEKNVSKDAKDALLSRKFFIQPLQDIYLKSDIGNEIGSNGNIKYLYILGSIAGFILLIACINFMNLSTARSEKRAREVGVRKVMGAGKSSLVSQFMGESFFMCMIALSLAVLLAWILLPVFNGITQKNLQLTNNPSLILWIAGLTIFTGLLAGIYPAFYLSSFNPTAVLKGRIMNRLSAIAIRKGLVVFQFTISICLILGAIIIGKQLDLLKNQHLGFKKDQQIILPLKNPQVSANYTALKNQLLEMPAVKNVTSGSSYPGVPILNDMLFFAEGKTPSDFVDIHLAVTESDYLETLGIELITGRAFSKDQTADSNSIILNEAALRQLGYNTKDAIGKKIYYQFLQKTRQELEIVGVVKDFNFESLHQHIRPFGFTTNRFANKYSYVIVNLKSTDYSAQVAAIGKAWQKINPQTPFMYSFLDQDFQKNYESDQRASRVVINFTFIAILIACLGLFGLASFSAERRTREIGIRKVLGASAMSVTKLLSKDFITLVIVAIVIASPIAWYVMNEWLQEFQYRTKISLWMFLAGGGIAVLVALATISFQAIKSAVANPVKSLRSE